MPETVPDSALWVGAGQRHGDPGVVVNRGWLRNIASKGIGNGCQTPHLLFVWL